MNQILSKAYFPNQNPIGKRFSFDSKQARMKLRSSGWQRDAKYTTQRDETPPTAYQSWLQTLPSMGRLHFRGPHQGNDPASFAGSIRQAMREVVRDLPLSNIKTQIEQADEALAMERMFAKLLTLFGLVAQQLAAIGLYGGHGLFRVGS